jgi:DNA-binding beta-propeller fold protein YncE
MFIWSTWKADARGQARSALTVGVWLAALLVCTAVSTVAQCKGPGAPTTTQTKCLTAIALGTPSDPGKPLRSFDISWVDPDRAEFYFADRSNGAIDIIDTKRDVFKKRIGGFVGIKLKSSGIAVDNDHSGPDGVVSHGKWLYAGDGDSTLKVIDLDSGKIVATLSTGGTARLDELALTPDGKILLAVNNADDPPFATLFKANGDDAGNSVTLLKKIMVDSSFIPNGSGLALEQPAWVESTKRFIVSVPNIANNPAGCNYGQSEGTHTCSGAILVIDPSNSKPLEKVVPLNHCGPNGASVGPRGNVMVGCTPNNQPGNIETTIINAKTFRYVAVGNVSGSDEVWFDEGSGRYYTASYANPGGSVLGVVDGETNFLLEAIPQSSFSHSVAADRQRHKVYVPQVAPKSVVGIGGDTTTVGEQICGSTNGCIAVYSTVSR